MRSDLVGRPMEVLLVEDNRMDARFAIRALEKANFKHRCTLVVHGEEALDYLQRRGIFARAPRPDLVLLDLGLPKKDGREVLTEIRADPNLPAFRVVVITTWENREEMQECEGLGVDAYITKPVDLNKFIALVKQLKKS